VSDLRTSLGVGIEAPEVEPPVDPPELEKNLRSARNLFSAGLSIVAISLSLVAAFPLFSVLAKLIMEGGAGLSYLALTEEPPSVMTTEGGGFGNAIEGTLYMVLFGCLLSIPFGILAATYLAEFGRQNRVAIAIRFATKILTGMPSILAGVFAFGIFVLGVFGRPSPFAGGVALAVLMVPTVILTAEAAIRSVPSKMKQAAVGMGCTPTQVMCKVTLPTALPGILTGIMLAIARAAGETAPLLFTAGFSFYYFDWSEPNSPMSSLSVLIYQFASSFSERQQALAWTAALVLVSFVLVVNLIGQFIISRSPMARR